VVATRASRRGVVDGDGQLADAIDVYVALSVLAAFEHPCEIPF
jgi:hypothetical protein